MSTESMITQLVNATSDAFEPMFSQMSWSEDEISTARQRHPHAADTLHHSFTLLQPTDRRINTEFVHRGHCHELLDRVARDEDTRPGTAAEVVAVLGEIATITPINTAAQGLLFRLWAQAFPEQQEIDGNQQHRETLYGERIDDAETFARTKTAVPDRVLGTIMCTGWHHGEQVACCYAR